MKALCLTCYRGSLSRMTVRLDERLSVGGLISSAQDQSCYCALWRHVLAAQITDACSKKPSIKKGVYEWVNSRDFEITCDFAEIDRKWVRENLTRILAQPQPTLAKHLMHQVRNVILSRS